MMKKLIYYSNNDWNIIKQRQQSISEALMEFYEVSVVYQHQYKRVGLQKTINDKNLKLHEIFMIPKSLEWKNDALFKINNFFGSCYLRKILRKIDYVILSYPNQINYVDKNFHGKIIYDCMDNYSHFINKKNISKFEMVEKSICDKSDLIFTSSKYLKNMIINKYEIKEEKIHIIRNGINYEVNFNYGNCNLKDNNPPFKIGYFGMVGDWFDFDLIKNSLDYFENIEYHIAGPISFKEKLLKDSRVIYYGTVEHKDLYKFAQKVDCFIMPFKLSEIVYAVDPVKLYEYIGFQKNIISIKYDEILRFKKFINFYESKDEFIKILASLMKDNNLMYDLDEASTFLENNSWRNRAKQIKDILEKI